MTEQNREAHKWLRVELSWWLQVRQHFSDKINFDIIAAVFIFSARVITDYWQGSCLKQTVT